MNLGKDPFKFEWFKNDQLIHHNFMNISIRNDEVSSTMYIKKIEKLHNDKYTCKVKNDYGEDSTSFQINVIGKLIPYLIMFR